jgi:hypothetical protein
MVGGGVVRFGEWLALLEEIGDRSHKTRQKHLAQARLSSKKADSDNSYRI